MMSSLADLIVAMVIPDSLPERTIVGIQGGISNGAHIYFDVGFKPPVTIGQTQITSNYDGQEKELENKGRHDPCMVPRAPPIIETMAAITVLDALLLHQSRNKLQTK